MLETNSVRQFVALLSAGDILKDHLQKILFKLPLAQNQVIEVLRDYISVVI